MRLTLRTLLAYLDGVPVDSVSAEEFGKKVEESEFVRNLVQRIRTTTARPRLAAPKIDGQGLGHDPNTIAAYLDSTLPQDRTPELEKICLESDVLLAEVAACHQILTLVLQHPAKVSPNLRDRVYRIGDLGKTPPVETAPTPPPVTEAPVPPQAPEPVSAATAPAAPVEEKPGPRKREIPEYLRQTRSLGWKPLALTVVLGFLLAAILLRAMGPFDSRHPLLGFLVANQPDDRQVAQVDGENDRGTDEAGPQTVLGAADRDDEQAGEDQTGDERAGEARPAAGDGDDEDVAPSENGAASAPDSRAAPSQPAPKAAVVEVDVESGATSDAKIKVAPSEEDAGVAEAPQAGEPTAPAGPGAGVAEAPAADPRPAPPDDAPRKTPAGGEVAARSPTTEDPIPPTIVAAATPGEKAAPPAASPTAEAGAFISEQEVLARYQPSANVWLRTPLNAPLASGDRLLAFPAYRPKIVLASRIQLTLGGGTLVELRPSPASGMANLAIEYGRVVFVPIGAPGGAVSLDLWGRQGEVTFTDATSLMAVQVRRYRSPGIDPEAGLAHRMVEIYAVRGGLLWREPGHPDQPISAGETFAFLDDTRGAVSATTQTPTWIESRDVERSDEIAAQDLEKLLAPERPLSLSLLEQVEHRKSEVRALAVRCLSYLDLFEPFVNAFNDESQKSYRDDHFLELQRALARSPETAAEVRIAFEKVRGQPAGSDLYRLLWSYSPDDLAGGAADKLVGYLEHESLDFRVLALENLKRITGTTLLYFPEVVESRRRVAAQRWRAKLAEGGIVYAENVLMLPPRLAPEARTP